jgi:hypothetical protein
MTIEGDSYFDLPRDPDSRDPSSLITLTSFMNASSEKTPEAQTTIDRSAEMPVVDTASEDKQLTGDVVLLVEDNAINMRVSFPQRTQLQFREAVSCTIAISKTCTDSFLTSC